MKNDLEKKVMRKVTLRIIPFIMLLPSLTASTLALPP